MRSKLWLIGIALTVVALLLPSVALAQGPGQDGTPVTVNVTSPDQLLLSGVIGPTVSVCGVVGLQVTGPKIVPDPEFLGSPTITLPVVQYPPSPCGG